MEAWKLSWTLLLLLIAVFTDICTGKVRNRLICLGISTGIFFQIWEFGMIGLFWSGIQIFFPVIVLFLLFLMHALGAGDIKLFSMIGSIWNLKLLCYCMIFSFLTGAVFSLLKLLYQKNLISRILYFCRYVKISLETRCIGIYERQSDGKQNTICFTIAILIGFCIAMEVVN